MMDENAATEGKDACPEVVDPIAAEVISMFDELSYRPMEKLEEMASEPAEVEAEGVDNRRRSRRTRRERIGGVQMTGEVVEIVEAEGVASEAEPAKEGAEASEVRAEGEVKGETRSRRSRRGGRGRKANVESENEVREAVTAEPVAEVKAGAVEVKAEEPVPVEKRRETRRVRKTSVQKAASSAENSVEAKEAAVAEGLQTNAVSVEGVSEVKAEVSVEEAGELRQRRVRRTRARKAEAETVAVEAAKSESAAPDVEVASEVVSERQDAVEGARRVRRTRRSRIGE